MVRKFKDPLLLFTESPCSVKSISNVLIIRSDKKHKCPLILFLMYHLLALSDISCHPSCLILLSLEGVSINSSAKPYKTLHQQYQFFSFWANFLNMGVDIKSLSLPKLKRYL